MLNDGRPRFQSASIICPAPTFSILQNVTSCTNSYLLHKFLPPAPNYPAADCNRGTAFGIFYTMMAVTAMGANMLFGSVWTSFGATRVFMLSASMMAVLLLALPWLLPASTRRAGKAEEPPAQSARLAPA